MSKKLNLTYENNKLICETGYMEDKVSAHLWRIDDLNPKDKERIAISGWTTDNTIEFPIHMPGTYYVQLLVQNSDIRVNSNRNTVNEEMLFNIYKNDDLASKIHEERKNKEENIRLLEKMYVTGAEQIISELKSHISRNETKLSIFAPTKNDLTLGRMIVSSEFFTDFITIDRLFSRERIILGYQMSVTFRHSSSPLRSFVKTATDNDILLVVDSSSLNPNDKILIEKLKKKKVHILYLTKIINNAFNNRFIFTPLQYAQKSGAKVLIIHFPNSSSIQNKSEIEEKVAQLTIKDLRAHLKNGEYPSAFNNLNVDKNYIEEVMAGWELVSHPGGYDTLKDKNGRYVNIQGGFRIIPDSLKTTTENTNSKNNNILFFGNSVMYGIGSDDYNNIPSLISGKLKESGYKYSTYNMSNFSMNDYIRAGNLIKKQNINKDDILIFGSHLVFSKAQVATIGASYLNLQPFYERPHDHGEVFVDMKHMNKSGYKIASDEIYRYLEQIGFLTNTK